MCTTSLHGIASSPDELPPMLQDDSEGHCEATCPAGFDEECILWSCMELEEDDDEEWVCHREL